MVESERPIRSYDDLGSGKVRYTLWMNITVELIVRTLADEHKLSLTRELIYFFGHQKKDIEREMCAQSLTRRFVVESRKLINVRDSLKGVVQCNKDILASWLAISVLTQAAS